MPISLKCPNGHHLTAKESNAGKTGKCPVCKASVSIPVLHQTAISESAIMHILGTPEAPPASKVGTTIAPPKKTVPPAAAAAAAATVAAATNAKHVASPSASSATLPHIKLCPSCEREIDMGYHICPHCHTYITGLNDF